MSVQSTQHIIYGICISDKNQVKEYFKTEESKGYDKYYLDSAFDQAILHKNGLMTLIDGMDGNFVLIGHMLQKSTDDKTINGPIAITSLLNTAGQDIIKGLITEQFPEYSHLSPDFYFLTFYR